MPQLQQSNFHLNFPAVLFKIDRKVQKLAFKFVGLILLSDCKWQLDAPKQNAAVRPWALVWQGRVVQIGRELSADNCQPFDINPSLSTLHCQHVIVNKF